MVEEIIHLKLKSIWNQLSEDMSKQLKESTRMIGAGIRRWMQNTPDIWKIIRQQKEREKEEKYYNNHTESELYRCKNLIKEYPYWNELEKKIISAESSLSLEPNSFIDHCYWLIDSVCKTILWEDWDDKYERKIKDNVAKTFKHIMNKNSMDKTKSWIIKWVIEKSVSMLDDISQARHTFGTLWHWKNIKMPHIEMIVLKTVARATDTIVGILIELHIEVSKNY